MQKINSLAASRTSVRMLAGSFEDYGGLDYVTSRVADFLRGQEPIAHADQILWGIYREEAGLDENWRQTLYRLLTGPSGLKVAAGLQYSPQSEMPFLCVTRGENSMSAYRNDRNLTFRLFEAGKPIPTFATIDDLVAEIVLRIG